MYLRMVCGETIYRNEECMRYGVTVRSINRDIQDIEETLEDWHNAPAQEIILGKGSGEYRLNPDWHNLLEPKETLAVCKVLLESRSLVNEEMEPIIDKLLDNCGGNERRKLVEKYIGNERYHYIELQHHEKLLDRLWELEKAVKEQWYTEISYQKLKNAESVVRRVQPVGIMFSEFYFYLTAYIEGIDKEKAFQNPKDKYPTIYRVDRIKEIKLLNEHFRLPPYEERFQEGEFRKRVQFMYGGRLRRLKFKYKGNSPESILDKLPTAEIIKKEDDGLIIQAEVFGDGVDKWIQSQGDYITVLKSTLL